MHADAAELNVIRQQFARFAARCRPYAPMYRQITLAGLRRRMCTAVARSIAASDTTTCATHGNTISQHDNQGRGFVLIGHSQGSFILAELIRQEIDGKPVAVDGWFRRSCRARPCRSTREGRRRAFQHVPLCRQRSQTGCVDHLRLVSFHGFRRRPTRCFGNVTDAGMEAACTNPAALDGGGGPLHAYLDDGRHDCRNLVTASHG